MQQVDALPSKNQVLCKLHNYCKLRLRVMCLILNIIFGGVIIVLAY